MTDWIDLERELDAWARIGLSATMWWRDDDAVTATPELRRLFDAAEAANRRSVPLALAVIPALADSALAQSLRAAECVVALQHGYAHTNHAAPEGKKAEFGVDRDPSAALRDLQDGARRMRELFADRGLPVLTPPWNRIAPALTGQLVDLGILGISTYGPRVTKRGEDNLVRVNTHVDIINWYDGYRFLGTGECLQLAISHLAARREGRVDPSEPTGLLTHHLVHDAAAWSFVAAFFERTSRHPAVCWMDARQLFSCSDDEPA